jgi:hypothetical protein
MSLRINEPRLDNRLKELFQREGTEDAETALADRLDRGDVLQTVDLTRFAPPDYQLVDVQGTGEPSGSARPIVDWDARAREIIQPSIQVSVNGAPSSLNLRIRAKRLVEIGQPDPSTESVDLFRSATDLSGTSYVFSWGTEAVDAANLYVPIPRRWIIPAGFGLQSVVSFTGGGTISTFNLDALIRYV